MFFSKIPILSKNKDKKSGCMPKLSVNMDMNAEVMYLQARIKVLEQENADLKEERENAERKLEAAEHYKDEILAMKEAKKAEKIKNQIEISKMRQHRNKSLNFSRRAQIAAERKLVESEEATKEKIQKIEKDAAEKLKNANKEASAALEAKHKEMRIWKDKFEKMDKIVEDFNSNVNKEWRLTELDIIWMISHLYSKRDQYVQLSRLRSSHGRETAIIEFRPQVSMAAVLGLGNDAATEIQIEKIRRVPLEGEPWAQNGKRR